MAATYQVAFRNGVSPGTQTVITNCQFRTDDNNTADNTNPCVIDTVLRYSFWKHIELVISGTFTQVQNIRHYSNGDISGWTLGTNGYLSRGNRDTGDIGCPTGSYVQATGTVGTTGATISASHTYYSGQTTKITNVNLDTSSAPALIDSTAYTSGNTTKGIVMQLLVDTATNGAVSGVMTSKTLTWIVDEI